jgi:hypothetical protein
MRTQKISADSKVHIIELNEFNLPFMRRVAEELALPNLLRALSYRHGVTRADQEIEHQGLDPWVQWVSIHTETPSQVHGVIRLGDVPHLKQSQIWERLGKQGVSTGVWGLMNAERRDAKNNLFFLADPWTFTSQPHPESLADFVALPGYYAKNYLDYSLSKALRAAFKTGSFLLRNVPLLNLVKDAAFLTRHAVKTPLGTPFLFCAFELLSSRVYAELRDKYRPDAHLIFLNSIAHFQHHDWNEQTIDLTARFVYRTIDRILGIVLPAEAAAERVLILNGFSQKNVANEELYCYRQINPDRFLRRAGLSFERVEQCMTNDGHVFFASPADAAKAARWLERARIKDQPAFYVEQLADDPSKLFYQVAYWGPADGSTQLVMNGRSTRFFDEFALHAKRTGAHVPEGDYLARGIDMPDEVRNAAVLGFLWPDQSAAAQDGRSQA